MGNEIDIDAWAPDPPEPEPDPAQRLLDEHLRAEAAAVASEQQAVDALDELLGPAPALKPTPKPDQPSAVDQLRAMVFASRSGGEPHIVLIVGEGAARDASCPCKAGIFNRPVGCYAMVFARTVWGLPAQGET